MSGVNLDLESLVGAERAVADPSEEDRDRVRLALAAKLGAAALATSGIALASSAQAATIVGAAAKATVAATPSVSASIATGSGFGALKLSSVIALSIALAATGATVWSRSRTGERSVAETPTARAHSSTTAPPRVDRVTATPPATRATRTDDSSQLLDEATLLGRARDSLRTGDAVRALALLDTYAARFPHGDLFIESEAARAISLCTLGRMAEGTALARRVAAAHPESPLAARALARCTR